MLLPTVFIISSQTQPNLEQVYKRISKLKGVEIHAIMVRPSTVRMTFKIAPGGHFYAKYPTSESYISVTEQTSFLTDLRMYDTTPTEHINPLPSGFDNLWPGGATLEQTQPSSNKSFAGKPAIEIPCKAPMGHQVSLYVDPKSLLPLGTTAIANGTTFEMQYTKVVERIINPSETTFIKPKDARKYSPSAPEAKLIRPGQQFPKINGIDLNGKAITATSLSTFKNGVVYNFWFSACTGCVKEMPVYATLAPKLAKRKIGFIGINPIDPASDAKKTSQSNKLPFPTLSGPPAVRLAESVGVLAYPVTIVVDPKGKVIDSIMGFNAERLYAALQKLGYKE